MSPTSSLLAAIMAAIRKDVAGVPTGPVSGKVFRDHDPVLEDVKPPYVTVLYPVTDPPGLQGDSRVLARRPDAQVDLWQSLAAEKDHDGLYEQLRDLLDGNKLLDANGQPLFAPGKIVRCRVTGGGRLTDPDDDVLHHAILLGIDHLAP